MRRLVAPFAVVAILAWVPAVATGGRVGHVPPSRWLSWNARAKTARLLLVAGYNSTNSGFNFDGYARGRLLVRVPRGWRLSVVCRNAGTRNHSCAVVRGAGSGRIAFPGATTPDPAVGLSPGRSATFTFRASRLGVYRFVCLVPGHELAREYDVLEIVGSGRPGVELLSATPG